MHRLVVSSRVSAGIFGAWNVGLPTNHKGGRQRAGKLVACCSRSMSRVYEYLHELWQWLNWMFLPKRIEAGKPEPIEER